jgi:hypothetical protein
LLAIASAVLRRFGASVVLSSLGEAEPFAFVVSVVIAGFD